MRGKCESCEFFELISDKGQCRIRSVETWPWRYEDDWCGEHREREPVAGKVEADARAYIMDQHRESFK